MPQSNSFDLSKLASASFCVCSPTDLQPFGDCLCGAPKNGNKVKMKIEVLKASIATLDYKLKHLTPYFSQLQIRIWRRNRRNLNKQVKFLEGVMKIASKQITASQILKEIELGKMTLLEHLKAQARKMAANDRAKAVDFTVPPPKS